MKTARCPVDLSARQRPKTGEKRESRGCNKKTDNRQDNDDYDETKTGRIEQATEQDTARKATAKDKAAGKKAEIDWEEF